MLLPPVNGKIGLTSDFEVLFVDGIRSQIVNTTVIVSLIAGVISTLPFFFYDLSEKKHREIINILKERASVSIGVIEDGQALSDDIEGEILV